ncbi:MAG TPA: nuclear transport factor 2 family protein [Pyrinomonadaceae bacterium]|nr:nuclear transport factor 2 family protein [Pyrinomonadaceae bacterium]
MKKLTGVAVSLLCAALACPAQTASSSAQRRRTTTTAASGATSPRVADAQLTGLYRIDLAQSDKLYSVVAGATSNLPFGDQQRFFIDLTVRLTPPDLLAIERRGERVTLASSRAPRISFAADGLTHSEKSGDGQIVNTRATLRANSLSVSVGSRGTDKFSVVFEPLEGGRLLRVTRRLSNEQLNEPIIIRSVYEKISNAARWDIYGEALPRPTPTRPDPTIASTPAGEADAPRGESAEAAFFLRRAFEEWIEATNARDIERQMSFYPPVLRAFYLTRNAPRAAVRAEKERVFRRARTVDVRAAAPELIFQEAGRAAVMRFRKSYVIEGGGQNRSGEVVQELRWQLTPQGWKIFSERDVRVIR